MKNSEVVYDEDCKDKAVEEVMRRVEQRKERSGLAGAGIFILQAGSRASRARKLCSGCHDASIKEDYSVNGNGLACAMVTLMVGGCTCSHSPLRS